MKVDLLDVKVNAEFSLSIKLSDSILIDCLYKKLDQDGLVQLLMYGVKHNGLSVWTRNVSEPVTCLTLRKDCEI